MHQKELDQKQKCFTRQGGICVLRPLHEFDCKLRSWQGYLSLLEQNPPRKTFIMAKRVMHDGGVYFTEWRFFRPFAVNAIVWQITKITLSQLIG